MKPRLIDIIEWVFATGCGLALVRACHHGHELGYYGLKPLVEPILVGFAVVGAFTLGWETLTQTPRKPWGLGRWTWAIAGPVVIVDLTVGLATTASWYYAKNRPFDPIASTLSSIPNQFYGQVSWLLLVFWTVRRFSGAPRDPVPDAREAAGRLLLIVIVAWGFAFRIDQIARLR